MDKVYVGLDLGSSTFQQAAINQDGRRDHESQLRDQRSQLAQRPRGQPRGMLSKPNWTIGRALNA